VPVPVLDLNDTAAVADFILREVGLLPASQPVPVSAPPSIRTGGDAAFDTVLIVDWSAKAAPSPEKPSADAIWIGICRAGHQESKYFRTRKQAEEAIVDLLDVEGAAGRRVLAGFDFPFGYPVGFAERLTGQASARSVWGWLASHVTDDTRNGTNRLAVGGQINALFAPDRGPFWGRPAGQPIANLPFKKDVDYAAIGISERRLIEQHLRGAKSTFQLMGAGSVGSQALTGLPMIHRLQQRNRSAVWPFDDIAHATLVLAEVYPSILNLAVLRDRPAVKDEAQVRLLANALWNLAHKGQLAQLFTVPNTAKEEGWILGAGHAALLEDALRWS
jgi:molybdopterin-guanine dinucleotide biosynthesis adapter protein